MDLEKRIEELEEEFVKFKEQQTQTLEQFKVDIISFIKQIEEIRNLSDDGKIVIMDLLNE